MLSLHGMEICKDWIYISKYVGEEWKETEKQKQCS